MHTLNETLWLTEDRKRAVPDGDESAAFLLGRKGAQINDALAERLGLTKSKPAVQNRDPVVANRDSAEPSNQSAKVQKNPLASHTPRPK